MKLSTLLLRLPALALLALGISTASAAETRITVTTVHPLLSDIARQVGGSHVSVVELMHPGDNIHHFEPSSSDIAKIRASSVLLASGKGLELYLPKLQDSLKSDPVRVVQVGSEVRSLKVSASSSVFVCCPAHSVGSIDPHWWHSVKGMKKSVAYVAKEFGAADPDHAEAYRANASAYLDRLDALESWAKREVSKVPRANRVLVTSHAAFGYFCKEFGFRSIPVAGLSEENVSSQYLAQAIEKIRDNAVVAVFPEKNASPKALDAITSATGVAMGGELIADGSYAGCSTYEEFIRHNITVVVESLAAQPSS